MRITYSFVGHGAVLEPRAGAVAVDVGNKLLPGVIDHHQRTEGPDCAASLILRQPELVLGHVGSGLDHVEIVMHREPDLDCVTSAHFVHELVAHGRLPLGASAIAEYVRRLDAGARPPDGIGPTSLAALYAAAVHLIEVTNVIDVEQEPECEETRFTRWVKRGLSLVRVALAARPQTAESIQLPEAIAGFEEEQVLVQQDIQRYDEDARRARFFRITLPMPLGGERDVLGMLALSPRAIMFKHFARADGVVYTHVVYPAGSPGGLRFSARHVLSVAPERGVWLKGLGAALERAEVRERSAHGAERGGEPRWADVTTNDPWYDGRSPVHGYTIVDTPRGGTALSDDQVREIALDPAAWMALGRVPLDRRCPERSCTHAVEAGNQELFCPSHSWRLVPRLIGARYEIQALLSQGGMGAVYEVREVVSQSRFALKLLHPDLFRESSLWHRFVQEARVLSSIQHPNVVRYFDFNADASAGLYLVMELLTGVTLAQDFRRLRVGKNVPYPLARLRTVVRQICDALDAIHRPGDGRDGLVHRDLKPSNVMLLEPPAGSLHVKLLDFGVAIAADPEVTRVTRGSPIVTAAYAAPEQLLPDRIVDATADIYALGCTIYEALCGKPPFAGDTAGILAKCSEKAPDLRIVKPGPLRDLLSEMLAFDPKCRPGSAVEVKNRVEQVEYGTV